MSRNVTADERGPDERFSLYRLCECPECGGSGKQPHANPLVDVLDAYGVTQTGGKSLREKCPECRGEGRIRQELATSSGETEQEQMQSIGVALVTLGREGEWADCAFGLLDRKPECEECEGSGKQRTWANLSFPEAPCPRCFGSGVKPHGTWLVLPWLPSARNVRDAARTLARSRNR